MAKNDDGNYKVGYGKPPPQRRFQSGQSGNPKGRPRGSKNLTTLLQQALDEKVIITENGRRKRITKREAWAKQLANKAASGDSRTAKFLYELNPKLEFDAKTRARALESKKPPGFSYSLEYWARIMIILYESGAVRNPPPGLKEAIETADWVKLQEIAEGPPTDQATEGFSGDTSLEE